MTIDALTPTSAATSLSRTSAYPLREKAAVAASRISARVRAALRVRFGRDSLGGIRPSSRVARGFVNHDRKNSARDRLCDQIERDRIVEAGGLTDRRFAAGVQADPRLRVAGQR